MSDINGVRLVIAEPQVFKDAIDSVSKLVDETNIILKSTHLEIVAMDPANIALVVLKMTKSEFTEYETGGEDTTFGLKLSSLKQMLTRGKEKDQVLTLSINGNQLKITFTGKSKKDFTLPLIDIEKRVQKVPDLKFNAEISIDNAELRDAVDDVAIVSDALSFVVDGSKFIVSGAGDQSKATTETKGGIRLIEKDKAARAKYSLEYVNKMISTKLSKNVKLFLGSDYPLKLSYVNDKGSISIDFVLAPRVDNS
jgi:proliferating cell nuclear antigen